MYSSQLCLCLTLFKALIISQQLSDYNITAIVRWLNSSFTHATVVLFILSTQEYEARLEAMLKLASELEAGNYHDKDQIMERCVMGEHVHVYFSQSTCADVCYTV